jgi:plastocyanin
MRNVIIGLSLFALSAPVLSAEHLVSQKNNAFTVTNVKAKVGDEVSFKNDDAVSHNVFSLSDAASFDLGSYGQGASKKVKLEKPGKVEVECAIHPSMKMTIDVSK